MESWKLPLARFDGQRWQLFGPLISGLQTNSGTSPAGYTLPSYRAVEVFERVIRHANPVGLFSEDIDPDTGALLGNFPQAYTHVGLIHAAMTISELLEARDGRARAWT